MSAHALRLHTGQLLRVVDLEGSQVADLVAYNAADPSERFSQGFTRMNNDKVGVSVGDRLYSNRNSAMLRVEDDTVGVHDMLFPPCNAFFYEHVMGIAGKTGCREHLASALADFGIAQDDVTDPFNVFMNTAVGESGAMVIRTAPSEAGDHIDLRAEMDLIVAVSACAADVTDCNGGRCTGIGLLVER
ncbi:MAG: uncharacterized protein QOH46_2327 [Solirubrobacteraceae bacterium]|jgi:uncharacterized protein YcgI (DUF1989 family)|nr:uncharacterized protein [Solirubrobacteraceae bacterium]